MILAGELCTSGIGRLPPVTCHESERASKLSHPHASKSLESSYNMISHTTHHLRSRRVCTKSALGHDLIMKFGNFLHDESLCGWQ